MAAFSNNLESDEMLKYLKRLFASSEVQQQTLVAPPPPSFFAKVGEYLERLGHRVEQRDMPTRVGGTNVEFADTTSAIYAIMERDAARQKAESAYFNDGLALSKPKFFEGPAGRLPFFPIPEHLK
jgi:hypothetical protein